LANCSFSVRIDFTLFGHAAFIFNGDPSVFRLDGIDLKISDPVPFI